MTKVDILIPTYNRVDDLKKNIDLVSKRIEKERLYGRFRLLISDNHSSDGTYKSISMLANKVPLECVVYWQEENIGLEANALFLLKKATADYVMYIGDDDFLPDGYLTYVVGRIDNDRSIGAIIPAFSALYADGSIKPSRRLGSKIEQYPPGFRTVIKMSQYGHQLSGILLRRDGLFDNYTENSELRNIYPFIYFLAYNNLRGRTYFARTYSVLVTQSNSKDWGYDESGLLTEIFRNYKILYPHSKLKETACCVSFMVQQRSRLHVGKDINAARNAFVHLFRSRDVNNLIKAMLPLIYVYSYSRAVAGRLVRVSLKHRLTE